MQKSTQILGVIILCLVGVVCVIGSAIAQAAGGKELRVTFLNVGQGDAIFVESPSGVQMLVDGGKNSAVIRELGRVMPFFDRSIDVIVGTHPDADHIGGLPGVLDRYDVSLIVHSSVNDQDGADQQAFDRAIVREIEQGAKRLVAERGERIDVGDGVYFEILFPDRDVTSIETNTGAIVGRIVYGDTAFMLSSDSPQAIEEYLVALDGERLASNVLKVGHHGSRTSSSLLFVGFVSPEYAVFSRGCDNSYGHPHEEVRAVFARFEVPTLDTCDDGAISFVSDGKTVRRD